MSDKKKGMDKIKQGFNKLFKGKKQTAFSGQGHVLGSGSQQLSQLRPPTNPRNQPPQELPPTPQSKPSPTPTQPWVLEEPSQGGKADEQLSPMTEFNPYQAAAISSTVLQAAVNVPKPNDNQMNTENNQSTTSTTQTVSASSTNQAAVQREEVGYSQERLDMAIALISSQDHGGACFDILRKLLSNILNNQSEQKFRKLRLLNPKINENIVYVSGGLELLQSVGFQIVEENEEQCVVLPLEADLAGVQAAFTYLQSMGTASNSALNSNQSSRFDVKSGSTSNTALTLSNGQQQEVPDQQQQLQSQIDRKTQVFLPVAPDTDVPEWFFERTPADIKREYMEAKKKHEQGQILMTKAMREKLQVSTNQQHKYAVIRIRFPEGVVMEGEFGIQENCTNIYLWVEGNLRFAGSTFELILPNRKALDQGKSVKEEDLAPSTLLNLRWSEQMEVEMKNVPGLKDELLGQGLSNSF